jgi:tetratricopeptide (TPR) repeat protein
LLLLAALAVLVLAVTPARVGYHVRRGRAELARRDYDAALEHFRAAEQVDPDRAETHFWLARVNRKLGDLDAVRRHLEIARERGYADRERLTREWRLVLAETGRVREVEHYLADMLTNPGEDDVEICEAFATGYCLDVRFTEALALLDAWRADYPNDFRPRLRRAQVFAGDHRWSEAASAFREALELAPDDPTVRRGLAETLVQLGRSKEAEPHFRVAVEKDPTDAEALIGLAKLLRERGAHQEAAEIVQRLLQREPKNFSAGVLLAQLNVAAGRAERAVALAAPLVELWPQDLPSRLVLAEALRAAGRLDEAESQSKVYAELQRHAQRLERDLRRELHKRPDDPEVRYQLGLYVLNYVSRSEGVAWLQSVLRYEPDHAGAHRALADYYTKVGELKLAHRHRRRAAAASSNPASLASGRLLSQGDPSQ